MLDGELPLRDDVRALQGNAGVMKQASEDRSAPGEREVCNYGERFLWPPVLAGIALDDLHCFDMAVAGSQPSCQRGIELDDNDACSRLGKCLREDAPTSADLDDELAPRDVGLGDEVSCELLTSDEVLAGRTPRGLSPYDHGPSPSSSHRDSTATWEGVGEEGGTAWDVKTSADLPRPAEGAVHVSRTVTSGASRGVPQRGRRG